MASASCNGMERFIQACCALCGRTATKPHTSAHFQTRVSLINKLSDKQREKYCGEREHCTGSIYMRILTVYILTRIDKIMICVAFWKHHAHEKHQCESFQTNKLAGHFTCTDQLVSAISGVRSTSTPTLTLFPSS